MVIATSYLSARKWPLLIVYLLIAFPFVLVKLLSSVDDSKNNLYIIFILFTHLLVLLLWYAIKKLEIQVYEQSIVYKTLFYKRELDWNDIIAVDLHFGFAGQHTHVKWIFSTPQRSIIIDPSYFSRKDNRFLAEVVMDRCSSAHISASIKSMAGGKFPWYVF